MYNQKIKDKLISIMPRSVQESICKYEVTLGDAEESYRNPLEAAQHYETAARIAFRLGHTDNTTAMMYVRASNNYEEYADSLKKATFRTCLESFVLNVNAAYLLDAIEDTCFNKHTANLLLKADKDLDYARRFAACTKNGSSVLKLIRRTTDVFFKLQENEEIQHEMKLLRIQEQM
jgi:hypothetical protein